MFAAVKEIVAELLWKSYMLSMIQSKINLKNLNVSFFTSSKGLKYKEKMKRRKNAHGVHFQNHQKRFYLEQSQII